MKEIRGFLILIGLDPSFNGFDYLAEAIALRLENPNLRFCEVYNEIAEMFGKNWNAIERGIRTTIKKAVYHHGTEIIEYLGQAPSFNTGSYANCLFISLCAEKIKNHEV